MSTQKEHLIEARALISEVMRAGIDRHARGKLSGAREELDYVIEEDTPEPVSSDGAREASIAEAQALWDRYKAACEAAHDAQQDWLRAIERVKR